MAAEREGGSGRDGGEERVKLSQGESWHKLSHLQHTYVYAKVLPLAFQPLTSGVGKKEEDVIKVVVILARGTPGTP